MGLLKKYNTYNIFAEPSSQERQSAQVQLPSEEGEDMNLCGL
jgi:hypothetical protein